MNVGQLFVPRRQAIRMASGADMIFETVIAELRIMGYDSARGQLCPVTNWFFENFVIKDDYPGITLLSGSEMRRHLFFATAPGNQQLYVSVKKNGIMRLLPVV